MGVKIEKLTIQGLHVLQLWYLRHKFSTSFNKFFVQALFFHTLSEFFLNTIRSKSLEIRCVKRSSYCMFAEVNFINQYTEISCISGPGMDRNGRISSQGRILDLIYGTIRGIWSNNRSDTGHPSMISSRMPDNLTNIRPYTGYQELIV